MEIKLTKKEYGVLMRLVYLGNWFVNAIRTQDNCIKEFEKMEQHILSFAKEQGFENDIKYDNEFKEYFPTKKFEEEMSLEHIDDYNNEIFWDELGGRLTNRDLIKKYGRDKLLSMSSEKRMHKVFALNDIYDEEFAENGLDNVLIKGLKK